MGVLIFSFQFRFGKILVGFDYCEC